MEQGTASRTALGAAVLRGVHRLRDDPPWILDDPFALVLVGPGWRGIDERQTEFSAFIRGPVLVRSRFAEDRLLAGDFTQYVVLGAGLDTFAWRHPEVIRAMTVFEVDHPDTQSWKRSRAAELGLPTFDRHIYVPTDFERHTLLADLEACGFDRAQSAFFSWLGVTMYLTRSAIEHTLRQVSGLRGKCEIAIHYAQRGVARPTAAGVLSERVSRIGEPLLSAFEPAEFEELVNNCGMKVVDHPSKDELHARYLSGRTDDLGLGAARLLVAACAGE